MLARIVEMSAQAGKQQMALDADADVIIYGGAAGSGKSRLLLLRTLKHVWNDIDFSAVLFRRTSPPLKAAGGLFTEAKKLYLPLHPKIREKDMEIIFEGTNGGNLKYTHLEHENDAEGNHQGLQYSFVGFKYIRALTQ